MSDWIKWTGGECPVGKGVRVECFLRVGNYLNEYGEKLDWGRLSDNDAADIIAYRIIGEVNSHQKTNKYAHPFTNRMNASETFDVYDVLTAFGVACPMRQHAIKKLLAAGQRNGGKSEMQDLQESLQSIHEAIKEIE